MDITKRLLLALLGLIAAAAMTAPAYAQGLPGGGCVDESGYAVNCDDAVVVVEEDNDDGRAMGGRTGIVRSFGTLDGEIPVPAVPGAPVVPAAAPPAAPVPSAASAAAPAAVLPDTGGMPIPLAAGGAVLAGLALFCGRALVRASRQD